MIPQVELFSFVFWKNSKHQKDISKLTDLYHQLYGVLGKARRSSESFGVEISGPEPGPGRGPRGPEGPRLLSRERLLAK